MPSSYKWSKAAATPRHGVIYLKKWKTIRINSNIFERLQSIIGDLPATEMAIEAPFWQNPQSMLKLTKISLGAIRRKAITKGGQDTLPKKDQTIRHRQRDASKNRSPPCYPISSRTQNWMVKLPRCHRCTYCKWFTISTNPAVSSAEKNGTTMGQLPQKTIRMG